MSDQERRTNPARDERVAAPRAAEPGELCTCGRQAITVYTRPNGDLIGHCGVEGSGARPILPCPWCGSRAAHRTYDVRPCPLYKITAPSEAGA